MKLSSNLVPIIQKNDFDTIASDFLKQYYPQALAKPIVVPIEDIALQSLKLQIRRVHLSEDLSILGQIFFNSGNAEVYHKDSDEIVYETVNKGTMFIDPDVAVERGAGSERNTITHECVHWHIHRHYHAIQIIAGGEKAVARRCPVKSPSEQFKSKWTAEDWMEWHANGIAPKILMPQFPFMDYVKKHPLYIQARKRNQAMSSIYADLLVDDLADLFQVSKQSASLRLSELGLV